MSPDDFDALLESTLRVPMSDDDFHALRYARRDEVTSLGSVEGERRTGRLGVVELVQGVNRLARRRADESDSHLLSLDVVPRNLRATFSSLLQEPVVAKALIELYNVERDHRLDFSRAEFHRLGTSSFVVFCHEQIGGGADSLPRALKCVLPQYWEIGDIKKNTTEYKDLYESWAFAHTPRVHSSGERYVLEDFVPWPTLGEMILTLRPPTEADTYEEQHSAFATSESFEFLDRLTSALCGVLSDYGRPHRDLSPSNVFVRTQAPERADIMLIDFGRNYVVQERIGTTRAFQAASLYMSPEALDANEDLDIKSDVYSLGVCLLQVISAATLTTENLRDRLDKVWEVAPGWARLIEDMIATNRAHRLSLMPSDETDPFTYIAKVATRESQIVKLFGGFTQGQVEHSFRERVARYLVTASRVPDPPGAPPLFRWWQSGLRQRSGLRDIAQRYKSGLDRSYQYADHLATWAGVAAGWWTVIWFLFVSLTILDMFDYPATLGIDLFQRFLSQHLPYEVGDLWGNLPGRLVALTFGICATAYYLNIFATITLRQVPTRTNVRAERAMRSCALLLAVPILVAMVYDPDLWPYMSALGTIGVVANNMLMLEVVRQAKGVERKLEGDDASSELQTFERVYREWWTLMAFYGVALLAVGVLISLDKAHDGWFYALCVALGGNLFKLYRLNSLRFADYARGNVSRAAFLLRKASALGMNVEPRRDLAPMWRRQRV